MNNTTREIIMSAFCAILSTEQYVFSYDEKYQAIDIYDINKQDFLNSYQDLTPDVKSCYETALITPYSVEIIHDAKKPSIIVENVIFEEWNERNVGKLDKLTLDENAEYSIGFKTMN